MLRLFDPTPFQMMALEPDIRPWMGFPLGSSEDDMRVIMAGAVLNPNNICLTTNAQDGGYIFTPTAPGLYMVHTLSLPSARGKPMSDLATDALEYMFTRTPAIEVATCVPEDNVPAMAWARHCGFKPAFLRPAAVSHPAKGPMDAVIMSLNYQQWSLRSAHAEEVGSAFHRELEELEAVGHPDDRAHDHAVGAAILCGMAGLLEKGVAHYNRWGAMAGYAPAHIISLYPPLVRVGSMLVSLTNEGLTIAPDPAQGAVMNTGIQTAH